MNHYTLREDEVLLYKGKAYRSTKGRKQVDVLLTNLCVVLIVKYDALIDQKETEILTYPIEEIKVYKNKPQVNRKDAQVEIYAKSGEEYLEFLSKADAKKFADIAWEEITNKTKLQRKIDKVKETVDYVDESFGIDTVQITKDTVKDGVVQKVLGGLKNMLPVKKKQDEIVKKKKDITKKNKKEQ
jgi:hypothetical protein